MAKVAAHGGVGFNFNCDLTTRFGGLSKRSFSESPIWISRRNYIGGLSSLEQWRASASGKKKRSKGEDRINGEKDRFNQELENEQIEEKYEFERDELSCFRGLVLDLSYRPVSIVCWKRAICLEFMEKAVVLEYYDQTVSSPSGSFYIPAVLRIPHLLQVVKRRTIKHGLSRKNILFRDKFTCQYCSSRENLTIDHVMPISRGGQWQWENLVAACVRCNSSKGQKILEETNMRLLKTPKAPKDYEILAIPLTLPAIKMLRTRKGVPEEWVQYLANTRLDSAIGERGYYTK
ncbi:hypothetical protein LUZ60_010246 [Juncus effusus]|nr:hypothetical protein LUZ60_010246 [Juncus effusus]